MSTRISGIGMTSQRTRLRMITRLREQGIVDEAVLNVMNEIPRHIFVEEALASRAYDDCALPIGFGQTISQPYIVARMTELLTGRPAARQGPRDRHRLRLPDGDFGAPVDRGLFGRAAAAVVVEGAAQRARAAGDEHPVQACRRPRRHTEAAPFDAIMVTAAATHVPDALKQQLAVGGRMVVPMGTSEQCLCLIERTRGGFAETRLDSVNFVPMLSGLR